MQRWKDSKDVTGDLSKSFLHAGTRIVRIRGGVATDNSQGSPALGLVVRGGVFYQCSLYEFLVDLCYRLQHDQRRISPLHAVPETDWL